MKNILSGINSPEDVKKLNTDQLKQLAEELRTYIIDVVSKNGGHLASSLGVVELTLALHKVFSTPEDKIIFDVGHQSYVHKIITGRRDQFRTLRQYGGISGFPKITESEHDAFGTGHSSTSISAALGFAVARDLHHDDYNIVAVIGDGAMSGGMAFEGLNNVGNAHKKLIVILNDNEMSIAENVGALSEYLNAIRTGDIYNSVKNRLTDLLKGIEYGENIISVVKRLKGSIKHLIVPTSVFEELGYTYLGPVDGHDINSLTEVLEGAKKLDGPVLVHVLTKKGKGYKPAEDNPSEFHGTGPFDVTTGEKIQSDGSTLTYTGVFSDAVLNEGENNNNLVAITAAMPDGTGLNKFAARFPDRFFDVGIAEQHAVTMAAGMAVAGLIPIVAVYSSFMQRGYDSIVHDVCNQNLHVVFCLDRAGIVGADGSTHHGIFDISFLLGIPNMIVMSPKDEGELALMLHTAIDCQGPVAIRYPRGKGLGVSVPKQENLLIGKSEVIQEGEKIVIWALGTMVETAQKVAENLSKNGIKAGIVNIRFAKPIDKELLLRQAGKYTNFVTMEEGILSGGVGEQILTALNEAGYLDRCHVLNLGIADTFVTHGKRDILLQNIGLDDKTVTVKIEEWLK